MAADLPYTRALDTGNRRFMAALDACAVFQSDREERVRLRSMFQGVRVIVETQEVEHYWTCEVAEKMDDHLSKRMQQIMEDISAEIHREVMGWPGLCGLPRLGSKGGSMAGKAEPYKSGELMEMAIRPDAYRDIDLRRVLATYADPSNWTQVYADQRCYWSWCGPTTVGYEFAAHALKYTEDGDAA